MEEVEVGQLLGEDEGEEELHDFDAILFDCEEKTPKVHLEM